MNEINLFKMPDVLHVANLTKGAKEIVIRNMEGEIIKRLKTTAESIDINVADLLPGNYFIGVYGDIIIDTKAFIRYCSHKAPADDIPLKTKPDSRIGDLLSFGKF